MDISVNTSLSGPPESSPLMSPFTSRVTDLLHFGRVPNSLLSSLLSLENQDSSPKEYMCTNAGLLFTPDLAFLLSSMFQIE